MSTPLPPELTEWVRLFRENGDARYFEKLYLSCRRAIFARCMRLLKDESQAEDVTHETFLRAFQRFDDFQGDNFLAWARSIATNLCLNHLRGNHTRQRLETQVPEDANPVVSPDLELQRNVQAERAAKVLQALGGEQRKVLLLKYLEGLSYAEISALTGFDHDQVRSLLQNGKRNFRLRWKECWSEVL